MSTNPWFDLIDAQPSQLRNSTLRRPIPTLSLSEPEVNVALPDGGRTLVEGAEPGMVGDCADCGSQLIETVCSVGGEQGVLILVCQDCDAEVRVEYSVGEENPWEVAESVDGVDNPTVKSIAWVDCPRCDGYGLVRDPFCDLRRAVAGREHPCPECQTTGTVPRLVETDGGHTSAEEWRDCIAGTWTGATEAYILAWDDPSQPVVADVDGQLKYLSNGHVGPVEIDVEQLGELLAQFGDPDISPLSNHADEFDRDLMEWTPDCRRDGDSA